MLAQTIWSKKQHGVATGQLIDATGILGSKTRPLPPCARTTSTSSRRVRVAWLGGHRITDISKSAVVFFCERPVAVRRLGLGQDSSDAQAAVPELSPNGTDCPASTAQVKLSKGRIYLNYAESMLTSNGLSAALPIAALASKVWR